MYIYTPPPLSFSLPRHDDEALESRPPARPLGSKNPSPHPRKWGWGFGFGKLESGFVLESGFGIFGIGICISSVGMGNEIGGDWTGMIWIKVGTGRRK